MQERDSFLPTLAVITVITLIFGSVILSRGCTSGPEVAAAAKKNAQQTLSTHYPDKVGGGWPIITCTETDSDGDGYVSCLYRLQEDGELLSIECKGTYNFGEGCRMPKATYVKGQR